MSKSIASGSRTFPCLIGVCVLAAASTMSRAAAPEVQCMRGPPDPVVVGPLLDLYRAQPAKAGDVTNALVRLVGRELIVAESQRAAAEILVSDLTVPLIPQSKDADDFNKKLAERVTHLCAFVSAPTQSQAREEENSERSAEAGAEPVEMEDTVRTALGAKLATAKQAFDGDNSTKTSGPSLQKLFEYHGAMLDCYGKKKRKPRGCDHQSLVQDSACIGIYDNTASCSSTIYDEIKRRNDVLDKQWTDALAVMADAKQTATIGDWRSTSAGWLKRAIAREAVRGASYGLSAGPSFVLQDGGDWKEGVEVFASFNTEAFDRNHCPGARICRGFFDASFLTPDTYPTEVDNDQDLPIAVFDTKGRLRIRAGYQLHWTDFLGMEFGIGVTSPISDQQNSVRAEPRAHIGLHLQTAYPDRAIGEVFVGYARDKSWERLVDTDGDLTTTTDQLLQQRFDRFLIEGTLLFPGVDLGGFSLAARLSADAPLSGNTQSEIRTSILLYYPLNSWLEKFRPTVKASESASQ